MGYRVILLSGNMTKEMERIAKEAGAFAVMAKPYDPQELLETVSRACHRPIILGTVIISWAQPLSRIYHGH